jgi:hypothetical protein
MKPPHQIRVVTFRSADPLALLRSAVKAGGLVALLRGEGLTRSTVEELLRPDSAAQLRSMLHMHVFPAEKAINPDPEGPSDRCNPVGGKLLVFKRKERSGR